MSEENNVNEMETMQNLVTLTDAEGNETVFEFLDLIDYQEETYAVLLPVESDTEVVILKAAMIDENTEAYTAVDSEETIMAVFEIFKDRFQDEFGFEE